MVGASGVLGVRVNGKSVLNVKIFDCPLFCTRFMLELLSFIHGSRFIFKVQVVQIALHKAAPAVVCSR